LVLEYGQVSSHKTSRDQDLSRHNYITNLNNDGYQKNNFLTIR